MTNHPTPVILNDEALAEIESLVSTRADGLLLVSAQRDALCQTVRALRAENEDLRTEIRDFKQEREGSDLGYMRQLDTYANANIRVAEENTALREQLAEAHKNIESLTQTIFRSEQSTRMRERCVTHLRATADAHERGSKVEFDDCSMVAFHLRKAATELESPLDGEKER